MTRKPKVKTAHMKLMLPTAMPAWIRWRRTVRSPKVR